MQEYTDFPISPDRVKQIPASNLVKEAQGTGLIGRALGREYTVLNRRLWNKLHEAGWTKHKTEEASRQTKGLSLKDIIHRQYIDLLRHKYMQQEGEQSRCLTAFAKNPNFSRDHHPDLPLPDEFRRYFYDEFVQTLFDPEFKYLANTDGSCSLVDYLNKEYAEMGMSFSYGRAHLPYQRSESAQDRKTKFLQDITLSTMGFDALEQIIEYKQANNGYVDDCPIVENNFPQVADNHEIPYIEVRRGKTKKRFYLFALHKITGELNPHSAMYIHDPDNREPNSTSFLETDFGYVVFGIEDMFPLPSGLAAIVHEIDHMVRSLEIANLGLAPGTFKTASTDANLFSEGTAEEAAYTFLRTQSCASKGVWQDIFQYLGVRKRWKRESDTYRHEVQNVYQYSIGGIIASVAKKLLGRAQYFRLLYQNPDLDQVTDLQNVIPQIASEMTTPPKLPDYVI
jgi:hypothetical protein